jgi:hypothetical protein
VGLPGAGSIFDDHRLIDLRRGGGIDQTRAGLGYRYDVILEIAERGRLSALYPEALYLHLRGAIDFNLRDESRGYERTDAFIEKTVAVAFDLLRTQVFDSALDLARFLIPCRERSAA